MRLVECRLFPVMAPAHADLVGESVSSVPASLDSLGAVRGPFLAFLQEHGMPAEAVEQWGLVFTEAFVNAVRHGNGGKGGELDVCWSAAGSRVTLQIEDSGPGIPPDRLTDPGLPDDPLSEGGRGLFLIRSFCPHVRSWVAAGGAGHRLVLERDHPGMDARHAMQALVESTFEELNSSFESLAAFYRLGNALIESERVAGFIASALKDLHAVVPSVRHFLGWAESVEPGLLQELQSLPAVVDWHQGAGAAPFAPILDEGKDLVFEAAEEVAAFPGLRPFHRGCCIPIRAADRVLGFIGVVRDATGSALLAKELNTLRTFGDLFGIAVAHAENAIARAREQQALREVEIAAELQETLVPTATPAPDPRWEIFLRREGARSVSGDYAEAMDMPDGSLLFVTVDVMGKGVSAAFVAGMLRTALRLLVALESDLPGLIGQLNHTLCMILGDLAFFATAALARVDPERRRLEVVNAGHCPVLLQVPGADTAHEVAPCAPPLGLFENQEYMIEPFALEPGLRLLMFTDGVYEWECGPGEIWGYRAFRELAARFDGPIDGLWQALQHTRGRAETHSGLEDDQTLMYWEFKG